MNSVGVRRLQLVAATMCAISATLNADSLSYEAAQFYQLVVGFLVVAWIMGDPAIPATSRPSLDYGFFLLFTFPFMAGWVLIANRGWKGAAILLGLMAIVFTPFVAWVAAA